MTWSRPATRTFFGRRRSNAHEHRPIGRDGALRRPVDINDLAATLRTPQRGVPTMIALEEIKARAEAAVPGAKIEIVPNPGPANQPSLLLDHEHAAAVASFLRDDPALKLDHCSNVTGIDWLDRKVTKKVKVKKLVEGVEKEVEEAQEEFFPGYLEAVYHLFSMTLKQGPVIIRMRTADRAQGARLPSLTPIWRSAEFQEREIFDLYGIRFDGHPDLRRILMWDEFADFPMRKDYQEPDDYEYEPTPHDEVLEKAKQHYAPRPQLDGAENLTATQQQ
jgi:NADH-quinone oxidoreductase subunit C